jgi:hypothetical protein
MRVLFILASFQNYENGAESNQLTDVGRGGGGWEASLSRGTGILCEPRTQRMLIFLLLAHCLEARSFFTVNT